MTPFAPSFQPCTAEELAQWQQALRPVGNGDGTRSKSYLDDVIERQVREVNREAQRIITEQTHANRAARAIVERQTRKPQSVRDEMPGAPLAGESTPAARRTGLRASDIVVEPRSRRPAGVTRSQPVEPPPLAEGEHRHRMLIERINGVEVGKCECGHVREYLDPEARRK